MKSMNEKMKEKKSKIITYIVFIFTVTVVIFSSVSLIFPALLVTSIVGSESNVNSFELGVWAIPFFVINLTILGFGLLYYRQLLPSVINKFFKSVLNFELSRKYTIIAFLTIIGIYIIFSSGELTLKEEDVWNDWKVLGEVIDEFPSGGEGPDGLRVLYVKNFLLYSSQQVFQNVKIIPFIGSITLVFLTYFFTVQLSQKRFAGLIAVIILLQSHSFLRYDTTATFSNFWVSFYLFSLYVIYKKWPLSPLTYVASLFSKPVTVAFFPMTLFFISRTSIPKKTKILLMISYLIIAGSLGGALFLAEGLGYGKMVKSFDYVDFVNGFTALAFQLRIDGLVLMFLLPLVFGLFLRSRNGIKEAESIMVFIAGIILSVPLVAGFTEFNIQPYRWIPLIVFFAIGVGVLLSKTLPNRSEN